MNWGRGSSRHGTGPISLWPVLASRVAAFAWGKRQTPLTTIFKVREIKKIRTPSRTGTREAAPRGGLRLFTRRHPNPLMLDAPEGRGRPHLTSPAPAAAGESLTGRRWRRINQCWLITRRAGTV